LTLPLFEPEFDRAGLAKKLRALAQDNIWIGTSSWKYEGWLGQIYSRERYVTRGRFSKKRFESDCLTEYSETFPTVCGDFSFYQFPAPEFWSKLFAAAPAELRVALKVPREALEDATVLRGMFLDPLEPYAARLGPLIFEFAARNQTLPEFIRTLEGLFANRSGSFRYAVEIRNREYLQADYFAFLQAYKVAHVFNSWTRMPALAEQMAIAEAYTTDFTVTRALLRPGRAYEQAVEKFQPYNRIQDENPEVRDSLRALIRRMREERRAAYIYVNNRLEGNAPETIQAVVAD
jgi:uncharacterized protein YecE (DUF72 family)